MPDRQSRSLRIAAARADFLENGRSAAAGVPEVLAASWLRSQQAGVDTGHPTPEFTEDFDPGSRLARCAEPVLTQLGNDTADMPMVIALTDRRARLLERRDSSAAVGRLLDRVEFAPGYTYAEGLVGTNGVGTVLEAGQSISIVGPEHYSEHLQPFACVGAPIVDPVTGRVEGILDITTLAASWNPLMHTLVKSASKDIARNLLLDRSQAQQALFETFVRADARATRQAVFAFSDSTSMLNAAAQAMFDTREQLAIREHAEFLMHRRDRASDELELASGRRVRIRGVRIVAGSRTAGVVVMAQTIAAGTIPQLLGAGWAAAADQAPQFAVEELPPIAVAGASTRRIVGDLRRPHAPIAGGEAPAWRRACAQLRDALAAGEPTIVLGESGSGKFTLVAELFHAEHPGSRSIVVDAAALRTPDAPDAEGLLGGHDTTLCIVRNLDQASTAGVEQLDVLFSRIASAARPIRLAATLSDSSLDSDLPFHALLGHFEVAVTIPPLRCRMEDLQVVVAALLAEIAPGRRVRLAPEAERTITRYSWPRNVAQLREALVHALRQRPVGEIQDHDLPSYCHTTARRTLTPIETAERDAIVNALHELDGNRVAAAARLGMSRSSLYRKLRQYGITS